MVVSHRDDAATHTVLHRFLKTQTYGGDLVTQGLYHRTT